MLRSSGGTVDADIQGTWLTADEVLVSSGVDLLRLSIAAERSFCIDSLAS